MSCYFQCMAIACMLVGLALSPRSSSAQTSTADTVITAVSLPPELERVLRDYEQAWEARDASALAALFAADGFVLRPGHPPVRGRSAIERAYRNAGGPLHLRAFSYAISDSIGYIIGGYAPSADRDDAGKFILTLVRDSDGRWLIAADMDNGNTRR